MRLVPRLFVQSFAILAVSCALALGVNAVRPDGPAPVYAAPSAVQLDKSGGEIGIKDAALMFITGRAVFLDARSGYEYQLGHVQGAISLPPREFAAQYQDIKPKLAGKEAVITYCDGELCPLSQALAKHLRDAGVKNVYVLKNGWTLWQAEKLPVTKGTAAGPAKPDQGGICRDCENK
jgi:Predicted sulfurtransferase